MKTAETSGNAAKLYTPEILGLAVELARFPRIENADFSAEARSRSCGSTLAIDLTVDADGCVTGVGLGVTACAIGQAAAVIFANSLVGKSRAGVEYSQQQMVRWLSGHNPVPEWPGIESLQNARRYPGRHEAILLPWRAAVEALSNA